MVSDSVSKKFGIEKSIGFGIENIWYRKKYRIRYRKNLVSEKSFGFGFVQILGIVTHCNRLTGVKCRATGVAKKKRKNKSFGSKPCKWQIWWSCRGQSQSGWTSYPLTNGCKLILNRRNAPGNTEKRQTLFSHFSPGSFFGSTSPAPSYVSLHRWLQGSPHCQACCPGWH